MLKIDLNGGDDQHCISFNLGPLDTGSPLCVGAIVGSDVTPGENVWVMGDRYVHIRSQSKLSLYSHFCMLAS